MSEVELWYLGVEGHNPSQPRYPVLLNTDPQENKNSSSRDEGFGRMDHRDGTIWYAKEVGNLGTPDHSVDVVGIIVGAYKIEVNLKSGETSRVKLSGFEYELRHRAIFGE